ncbi:MAG: PTS sugar transporter subunit IIA [Streptosporangiales bacterium]|nr:PTS sugar transporter subunit IIA [Streptosporangiales bacterium]
MPEQSGSKSLLDLLPESAIGIGMPADDWRGAIGAAGSLLVDSGATTGDYTGEMIETVEKLGPYIVIIPGLALAHARPSPSVLHTGLSWAALATPVDFGNAQNDPVRLVVGLAAVDHTEHSGGLAQLARMLSDTDRMDALMTASSPAEVRRIISEYEGAEQ